MKIIAIIQARLGSTRLPNKVLKELLPGESVLNCMLYRVKKSKLINYIIVATTKNQKDRKLVSYLEKIGQKYFVGKEDDVLDRYYQAARAEGAQSSDIIVRLTADCPVIDPKIIDTVIGRYLDGGYDFVSNSLEPYSYPDGMDVEVFSFKNLKRARREAVLPSHREHVTFYFWQNQNIFKINYVKNDKNLSDYRLTLDYQEDYLLLKKIYEHFKNYDFTMQEIIDYLDINPKIKDINSSAKRNAGWQSALGEEKD